jgi:hypothetical protein
VLPPEKYRADLDLHKYEPAVQGALEAYLIELGVMQSGESLMPSQASGFESSVMGSMH